MNHEQKRPDAMQEYHGKGPHLIINWDMIEPGWESQWYGDDESYIGSTDDGAGDPRVGYAPYDWDSIMHYPLQGKGTTNPPGNEHRLGARTIASTLSPGDIRQVHDMCKIPHKCCLFMTISSVLSVVSLFFFRPVSCHRRWSAQLPPAGLDSVLRHAILRGAWRG